MAEFKTRYELSQMRQQTAADAVTAESAGNAPDAPGSETGSGFFARARARASAVLKRVPGGEVVESGLRQAERSVLRELRERLEATSDRVRGKAPEAEAEREPSISRTYVVNVPEPASKVLGDLLQRARNQTPEQARALLHSRLLQQLVPDEATLLALFADGKTRASVRLTLAPLMGAAAVDVAEHLSDAGSALALPEHTPLYLAHLVRLGLLDCGAEARDLADAYAALESGADARRRVAAARAPARFNPRFVRRSLRLSDLGRQVWDASTAPAAAPMEALP